MIAHFRVDIEIPFEPYPTKKLNERAVRSLRRSLRDMFENTFFDLYVEEVDTPDGKAFVADASGEAKCHVIFIRTEE